MTDGRSRLQHITYNLSRMAVRLVGRLLFGLQLQGAEKFPAEGGGLVCSNHQSSLDPLLLGGLCNRRMNYLARESLFENRLWGALIRWYDAIPVRRDGMSITGLKATLQRLRGGELVVIFPEGTRTENGQVGELKSGFCMLARKAKVPLIPVGIAGAYEVWPRGSCCPRPGRICLQAGEAISAAEVSQLTDDELVAMLEDRIRGCFQSASRARDR